MTGHRLHEKHAENQLRIFCYRYDYCFVVVVVVVVVNSQ